MIPSSVELESVPCPLGCQRDDREVLKGPDRLMGIPGLYRVVACKSCGLMRTEPRPTPASIGLFYPDHYGPYQLVRGATRKAAGVRGAFSRLFDLQDRQLPKSPPGRLLEIGCASGGYMLQMEQEGWTVEGIEFSENAGKAAQAEGLKVQISSVEQADSPEEQVDVIAAWMVLEHLHEPTVALSRLRTWIKPDGYLVVSIPDAASIERRIFGNAWYALQLPTHLYHYSPATLAQLLARTGWEMTRVRWQRNPMNLLRSLEYKCRDWRMQRLEKIVRYLADSPKLSAARRLLGLLLGLTRQSGRIEVWARPR